MSYFKVGEPYYKIGDWVNIILPEYGRKTIWKIIEIEFSPGELPIVKLKNVFHYDETVETTIDNIRPVAVEFKKLFPDYYKREFLFDNKTKGERDMYYLACDIKTKNTVACYTNIKNVIFNDPATIIFWKDGSKTVVKCGPDEKYDPEKGMAMAIAKRVYGTSETGGNYYNIFKKWLSEEKTVLNFE